ncbi:TPA: DUF1642 domain-containing protein [Streptococcus agalactiae]|nr:DUF1642 domain-containing protein [Streptococcus agalactiae]
MNIEEAKEKLHNIAYRDLQTKPYDLKLADVIQILNQIKLDQPKPEVPQFVADWYENNKEGIFETIIELIRIDEQLMYVQANPPIISEKDKRFLDWFFGEDCAFEIIVNMHQFGYTVEKEKLYTVEIPNPNERQLSFVLMRQLSGNVSIKVMHRDNLDLLKIDNDLQLTESEIRKDFDWAFRWAKEVE